MKCDLIKLLCNFIEIALRYGFSPVNLLHNFRTTFYKNTYGGLLLRGLIQCGLFNKYYYGKWVRHLNVRIGEQIGFSPMTKKKVKPKSSTASDHLLLCNRSQSFASLISLTKENRTFVLAVKESLFIMRDKPSFNRNFRRAPLYLFDKT